MNTAALACLSSVTPSQVQAFAGRNLDFLSTIEKTVDCLGGNTKVLYALAREIDELLGKLKNNHYPTKLDPDSRVCVLLASSEGAIERMHQVAIAKRAAARHDKRLTADDGIEAAYCEFIAALADHHQMLDSLREHVETHDSLLDAPTGNTYDSAEALFAAMGIKAA